MNFYLIGYMGSGKTTTGKKLANYLNYTFLDLDKYIENKLNTSISELFANNREQYFRNIETEALNDTKKNINAIISTGGGTPCFNNNINLINSIGISVYLKLPVKVLFSRLKNSKSKRPLIADLNEQQLYKYIELTLSEREYYYNQCNIEFNKLDFRINELANKITEFIS